MRTLCEHLRIVRIIFVYLAALEYLQADGTITIISKERSATWFANILHYSTYTHRAIKLLLKICHKFCAFQVVYSWFMAT